jgi:hypothetical protein
MILHSDVLNVYTTFLDSKLEKAGRVSETTWIYGLFDPSTKEIKYVGASVRPVERYRQHLTRQQQHTVHGGESKKNEWLAELEDSGTEPELVILEEVEARSYTIGKRHPDVAEAEDRWMVKLIKEGHSLTNAKIPRQRIKSDEQIFEEAIRRGKEMFGENP